MRPRWTSSPPSKAPVRRPGAGFARPDHAAPAIAPRHPLGWRGAFRCIPAALVGVYLGMATRTRTVTPPVDAAEAVVILATLAGCAFLFGVTVLMEANRIARTFGVWAPALFVLGGLCAVGALVLHFSRRRS